MAQFYVEVTEIKKWIFSEIEADTVELASDIALNIAEVQGFKSIEKFVNHVRAL